MRKGVLFFIVCCFFLSADAQVVHKWKADQIQGHLKASGKEIVVLNVWATFCRPCVEEIPFFIDVCKSRANQVDMVFMSVDTKELFPQKLKRFIKKKRYHFGTWSWLDETDANYFCPFVDGNWEGSIPATLILNTRSGRRYFNEGSMTAAELKKVLDDFLTDN